MTEDDFQLLCTEIRLSPKGRFILRLANTDVGVELVEYSADYPKWRVRTDLSTAQWQHLHTAVGLSLRPAHGT